MVNGRIRPVYSGEDGEYCIIDGDRVPMPEVIRFSKDAKIRIVWDTVTNQPARWPTPQDMDRLPFGGDLTDDEIDAIE